MEAACWMAGRDHDYPEQFAAGLEPHAVQEKYYYARRPEINRVVDVSGVVDQNDRRQPRQPGQGAGRQSRLAAPGRAGQEAARDCRSWATTTSTADRNYIKEFILARSRELGQKHGVEYAEAFHYIGRGRRGGSRTTSASTRCP